MNYRGIYIDRHLCLVIGRDQKGVSAAAFYSAQNLFVVIKKKFKKKLCYFKFQQSQLCRWKICFTIHSLWLHKTFL